MGTDSLPSFIEQVTGDSHLRVESDLGGGFVRLLSSEAERRQAKQDIRSVEDIVIEMLRNSRDAGAHLIFVSTAREGSLRRLTIIDDGQGIPASVQEAIFEPRVTNKLDTGHMDRWGMHGRGMASVQHTARTRWRRGRLGTGSGGSARGSRHLRAARAHPNSRPCRIFALSEGGRPGYAGRATSTAWWPEFAWEAPALPGVLGLAQRDKCRHAGGPRACGLDATAAASLGAGESRRRRCACGRLCATPPAALAQQRPRCWG